MTSLGQLCRQLHEALRRPAQWRLRVASRRGVHQLEQDTDDARFDLLDLLPASSSTSLPASRQLEPFDIGEFCQTPTDRADRQPRRPTHRGFPAVADLHRLVRGEQPSASLRQGRGEPLETSSHLGFLLGVSTGHGGQLAISRPRRQLTASALAIGSRIARVGRSLSRSCYFCFPSSRSGASWGVKLIGCFPERPERRIRDLGLAHRARDRRSGRVAHAQGTDLRSPGRARCLVSRSSPQRLARRTGPGRCAGPAGVARGGRVRPSGRRASGRGHDRDLVRGCRSAGGPPRRSPRGLRCAPPGVSEGGSAPVPRTPQPTVPIDGHPRRDGDGDACAEGPVPTPVGAEPRRRGHRKCPTRRGLVAVPARLVLQRRTPRALHRDRGHSHLGSHAGRGRRRDRRCPGDGHRLRSPDVQPADATVPTARDPRAGACRSHPYRRAAEPAPHHHVGGRTGSLARPTSRDQVRRRRVSLCRGGSRAARARPRDRREHPARDRGPDRRGQEHRARSAPPVQGSYRRASHHRRHRPSTARRLGPARSRRPRATGCSTAARHRSRERGRHP